MATIPKSIMAYANARPEATPICPGALLHLGKRAAVDQALSRLARSGKLFRICHGVYMRPVNSRFGELLPEIGLAVRSLADLWGVTIVPCGGAAANNLGLTTQNPIRAVYLTSGPSRKLHFEGIIVELRHAPRWQLVAPRCKVGELIRALSWFGPSEVEDQLALAIPKLSSAELTELSEARALMPIWMAEPVSELVTDA